MDIHDENENKNNHENASEHESTSDDIPLWLQGLEARDPDETKPISPDKAVAASWIRETEATKIDQSPGTTDEVGEVIAEDEASSLGEIQEEIKVEDFTEDQMTELSLNLDQDQQEDDLGSEGEQSPESEPTIDESASHAGFVDISGMEISEQADQEEVNLDDEPLREGDLPDWLQEMIAETEEESPSDAGFIEVKAPEEVEEFSIEDHETTETEEEMPGDAGFIEIKAPDEVVEYIIEDVETTAAEEVVQEISAEEDIPVMEPELQADAAPDVTFAIPEEETSPLELSLEEAEITPPLEEETYDEAEPSAEQKSLLETAKEHITQGAVDEAIPLLRELVDESDNLEDLKDWLDEIAETDIAQHSELMEIIGDVAMIQNAPGDAFDAYAKAIGILLKSGGALDEIG